VRRLPRWGMVGCLALEWVALAVWVGGIVVLSGAVIPAVFNTFGGQDVGGMFLTRAFENYHRFVLGACAVLCTTLWCRWWSGDPTLEVGRSEMIILAVMVTIAGLIIVVLHPQAVALQTQAFAAKDETRKAALEGMFRILWPVRFLYLTNVVLGLMLIVIKAKRSLSPAGVRP
jgi:uncharacterized membrane protein